MENAYFILALENQTLRYGELKKLLESVSHKKLSQHLKELESDNLITRKEYPTIPPKVEYSLSELGKTPLKRRCYI